ncbi:PadR family transcriptional regulator [Actinosynnema sp. NPDC050436]|uniref:PadR family transcriptional regulator n=1 Tax=Actinosynnema sp. NPDC050436 TaxID=3155659 RepID=UPI0034031D3C
MVELTPAELTLLGLLVEQPRHGYELDEVITGRGMREWTEIGFSSIYYLLGRLRDRGLVAETGPERGPGARRRKVFAATAEGRAACAAAAEEAIAVPRPVFPPVLVGLANLPVVPRDRLLPALERRAAALAEREREVRAAAARPAPDFVRAIFDYTLAQLAAEQDWLAGYRAAWATTVPPTGVSTALPAAPAESPGVTSPVTPADSPPTARAKSPPVVPTTPPTAPPAESSGSRTVPGTGREAGGR